MARLPGLHKRMSKAEELELELARQGSVARLERLLAQRAGIVLDDGAPVDPDAVPADGVEATDEISRVAAMPPEQAVAVEYPAFAADNDVEIETEGTIGVVAGGSELDMAEVADARADLPSAIESDAQPPATVMLPGPIDATRRRAVRRPPSVLVAEDDWDTTGVDVPDDAPGVSEPGTEAGSAVVPEAAAPAPEAAVPEAAAPAPEVAVQTRRPRALRATP
ncbi:MAG TPA: hypothetical protein VLQ79_14020, partial [Myxococcaceae bacterium]|nr:hypothetical protein [Myxococcaceae bacterium]